MSKNNVNVESRTEFKRELGLGAATAIVVGNMIGSGIFMSPTSMSLVSNPKAIIWAWIITCVGALLIALNFAKLGSAMPKTGGPIVYTRAAFGDFAGFLIAWSYWVGAWVGNAAIITGFMSYLSYFFPVFADNRLLAFLVSSAVLWTFTFINYKGVKEAGIIGVVTTVLKLVPLVVFVVIAGMHFNPENLNTVSSKEVAGMGTVPAAIGIALWAFIGLESATVPAGEIKDPEKNIRKSTIYGTLACAAIYLLISLAAMGAAPQAIIAKSNAPLADILNSVTGAKWGGNFMALGGLVSTLGCVSGWILTTARSSFAAGEDKLFPKAFAKIHPKYKTPYVSLIVSGVAANILLILNYVQSLTSAFNFMILLATLAFLPAYALCATAEIVLLVKKSSDFNLFSFLKNSFFSLLAFAFSIYFTYSTGAETVMYGFILLLVGVPFYVYMMLQDNNEINRLRKNAGI